MKNLQTSRQKSAGMALVIVLALLLIVFVLVVGFLGRSTTEHAAATSYGDAVSLRILSDTAVNLVQAQIDHATRRGVEANWVSQPGMIRVFETAGMTGYKLYSSDLMTTNSITSGMDLPTAGWDSAPSALWVDLNRSSSVNGRAVYPIMDPKAADGDNAVQGFEISPMAGSTTPNPVMPVRWMYVLQDGKIVLPKAGGSNAEVTFDQSVVTVSNPIVGRIAFWTDDDSCKVNLNTASEGIYWDIPRAFSSQESKFGEFQPATGEYARYPGHPATTSLSAVFPELTAEEILSSRLSPRFRWGGSRAGTAIATTPLEVGTDRLYASSSEVAYLPNRSPGPVSTADAATRSFFLTAHSRAPETNLFNLPRVAIWPLHVMNDADHRTLYDQQIARASTVNGAPYYFQRETALDPGHDLRDIARNLELYDYLETLMGRTPPGFSGTFSVKYGAGTAQILTEIFDYVRSANLVDPALAASPSGVTYTPKTTASSVMMPGYGAVAPIHHPTNGTMGFGRFYTLAELSMIFICTADPATPASNVAPGSGTPATENRTLDANAALASNQKRVQAMVLMRMFSPAQGWVTMWPMMRVEVTGLSGLQMNGQSFFPATADGSIGVNKSADYAAFGSTTGGNPGIYYLMANRGAGGRGNMPPDSLGAEETIYPFISNYLTVDTTTGTMNLTGGRVTVKIYATDGGTDRLVQTIPVDIPSGPIPIPNLVTTAGVKGGLPPSLWWSFSKTGVFGGGGDGRLKGVSAGMSSTTGGGSGIAAEGALFVDNGYRDVVFSMIPRHGDMRLIAAQKNVPSTEFIPHPDWSPANSKAYLLYTQDRYNNYPTHSSAGSLLQGISYRESAGQPLFDPDFPPMAVADRPALSPDISGDFDNGTPTSLDGAYINKPDEGNTDRSGQIPYMRWDTLNGLAGQTFFSPNRQMPSPGMFGSLPTGIAAGQPWQTLLFRKQDTHPQSAARRSGLPPDHLMMDLFWMPVVEPYAISEPFSTAGKVNLNYQIMPFTNIRRATGLYAILKGEKLAAIPDTDGTQYKNRNGAMSGEYRLDINIPETLKQFDTRFSNNEVFKSATEICDLWMVPEGQSVGGMEAFWTSHRLTGDNLRERIYTTVYPRVTTRSNTYTVHTWVQAIRPADSKVPHVWNEAKGKILGNYRGSTSLERFIDPNNEEIPNYASRLSELSTLPALDKFYRWRVIGNTTFSP